MMRLRELQELEAHEPPLWFWEYGRAIRLAELRGGDQRDQMKMLAKFLAQKQLHIMHGPLRQVSIPGRLEWNKEMQKEVSQEYFTLLTQLHRAGSAICWRGRALPVLPGWEIGLGMKCFACWMWISLGGPRVSRASPDARRGCCRKAMACGPIFA